MEDGTTVETGAGEEGRELEGFGWVIEAIEEVKETEGIQEVVIEEEIVTEEVIEEDGRENITRRGDMTTEEAVETEAQEVVEEEVMVAGGEAVRGEEGVPGEDRVDTVTNPGIGRRLYLA